MRDEAFGNGYAADGLGRLMDEWRERAEAAEAKNERWQAEMDDACKKVLKMHQKLRVVGDAIEPLRDLAEDIGLTGYDDWGNLLARIADELDALLKGDAL